MQIATATVKLEIDKSAFNSQMTKAQSDISNAVNRASTRLNTSLSSTISALNTVAQKISQVFMKISATGIAIAFKAIHAFLKTSSDAAIEFRGKIDELNGAFARLGEKILKIEIGGKNASQWIDVLISKMDSLGVQALSKWIKLFLNILAISVAIIAAIKSISIGIQLFRFIKPLAVMAPATLAAATPAVNAQVIASTLVSKIAAAFFTGVALSFGAGKLGQYLINGFKSNNVNPLDKNYVSAQQMEFNSTVLSGRGQLNLDTLRRDKTARIAKSLSEINKFIEILSDRLAGVVSASKAILNKPSLVGDLGPANTKAGAMGELNKEFGKSGEISSLIANVNSAIALVDENIIGLKTKAKLAKVDITTPGSEYNKQLKVLEEQRDKFTSTKDSLVGNRNSLIDGINELYKALFSSLKDARDAILEKVTSRSELSSKIETLNIENWENEKKIAKLKKAPLLDKTVSITGGMVGADELSNSVQQRIIEGLQNDMNRQLELEAAKKQRDEEIKTLQQEISNNTKDQNTLTTEQNTLTKEIAASIKQWNLPAEGAFY